MISTGGQTGNRIELVVFDLDGTLVDSRKDLADATNAVLLEFGGQPLPEDEIVAMVGEGAEMLVRRALATAGLEAAPPGALERFLVVYDDRLLDHTGPYPGMTATLDALAADRALAVLTNKPLAATVRILDALDLRRHFGGVVGGDSPWGRKPDPGGLLHLAREAGVPPARTLLVGDSAVDLETARRSGARICLCRYGFGYRFAPEAFRGDEWFIDEPPALLRLLGAASGTP